MSDGGAKQQIVDKIKNTTNILVTVSNNPSVDELSAALGLTLLLNKMKKHATAVFSGQVPPSINFLDPAKTFENTVDSLRDFIIALDKEKADHLRYKIEGDVVKIFITPYRTTITSSDLEFAQGDYNVELVLALGAKNQESLDRALEAHGRILHDATVATITAGGEEGKLGSIGWREENASSLSEMMIGLTEALKADKTLLDEQIATAFLAGIVAATDRFSNNRTSAKVMTMAAQLMGAGANQQLIASKFEEADGTGAQELGAPEHQSDSAPEAPVAQPHPDGTTELSEGESTKLERTEEEPAPVDPAPLESPGDSGQGTLTIAHSESEDDENDAQPEGDIEQAAAEEQIEEAAAIIEEELAKQTRAVEAERQAAAAAAAEQELASQLPPVVPGGAGSLSVADLQKDIASASADVAAAADTTSPQLQGAVNSEAWKGVGEPTFGGTLNATTEQAQEEARKAEEEARNRTILSHSQYIGTGSPAYSAPFNAASLPSDDDTLPVDPLQGGMPPTVSAQPVQPPTLAELDQQNRAPGLPPLPDFSTLPPLPPAPGSHSDSTASSVQPPPPLPQDPGQFQIPGASAS